VRWLNGGISGDNAGGVLARLEADILVHRPTAAVVMLGMNDVGRDSYKEGTNGDAKVVARRQQSLDAYQAGMTKLGPRLQAGGVKRLVLVTPSPFDQTALIAKENLPGVNDALGRCGVFVREFAVQSSAGLVDLHGPMTALNQQRQQADPAFTLIGADRVHPGAPGHLVMAWLFLKAQGAPALVSRVVLDALARKVLEAREARLEAVTWPADGVAFTLLENALPWPIEDTAQAALALVPIMDELNRQELVVRGLSPGAYELRIDDIAVGRWTAADFAAGINLAALAATPQLAQARAVQKLCEERRAIQADLRSIPYVELKWFRSTKVDPSDAAAVSAALDAHVAKSGATAGYYRTVADAYRTAKPQAARLWQQIDELTARIRTAARPAPHHYTVRRTAD
jgi:lysophospholipase L1-like esterase